MFLWRELRLTTVLARQVIKRLSGCVAFLVMMVPVSFVQAGEGKLIATPGVTQFEGGGGGGLVPWAVLSGYASRDEVAVQVFATDLALDDFDMVAYGVGFSFKDRLEVTAARQELDVNPLGVTLRQNVIGAKVRIYGDAVYSKWPQVSVGVQHKRLLDTAVPVAVGADQTHGTDVYLAATKIHLGAAAGYNLLWNLTVRSTRANQAGFLGFGGDKRNGRSLQLEGSVAVLFGRHVAVGAEYRYKPDNLSFAREQDWKDVFVAWIPNKRFNITAAYVDAGDIAGLADQDGVYISMTGYLR